MTRPPKKRKIQDAPDQVASGSITNATDIQNLLVDYTGSGVRSFKDLLNRCSKGLDVEETEAAANRAILKQYLETQCRKVGEDDERKGLGTFPDLVQIWGYASQNNSISLLTLVPATLAILVRVCSYHNDFHTYGAALIKAILQQPNLKIIYRGLSGNKDHVVSPCLRLLTEMNRFNFGAMCGYVHSSFDFTPKDLPRSLEMKGGAKIEVEDPARPSVRTLCVRFFLSFLQNGQPSVRNEMLGLRNWVSPIFKHLKTDTPSIIHDLLECMLRKIIAEKEIPRATKLNVFNEWILGHILALYSRDESVKVSRHGKNEDKSIAELAHEFLLEVCTKRGSGVCFPDHGWYPPGYVENEDKRRRVPKVYNRILSSFAAGIRPFADTLQLDLMLEIFKTCPELVADHFLSNSSFGFDPKLTSTWVGYCTFIVSTISLPIPEYFGAPAVLTIPPPTTVVVENILPKPLNKIITTKSLTHDNSLIRFFTTRLLICAFQKLHAVLDAIDNAAAAVHDPSESWKKCKFEVVEEFCKRIPDASAVGAVGAKHDDVLQTEANMRLRAEYYVTIPEMALSGKFDVNVALATFLANEGDDDQNGMRLLEMGHLLKISNEVPDVKWWNKTPAMKHSPFVTILKLCCDSATKAPLRQVRALLHSFASTSYLFQTETLASPLDALLESLSIVTIKDHLDAILSLLDEVVGRCIRTPFKYLDDYAELALEVKKTTPGTTDLAPVSPIIMTLVEQWKFFTQGKNTLEAKLAGAGWLSRFLDSCALVGENRFVLAVLCDRLVPCSPDGQSKSIFSMSRQFFQRDMSLKLYNRAVEDIDVVGIRDLFTTSRDIDISIIPFLLDRVQHRRVEASLFDLTVVQRAITEVVNSENIISSDASAAVWSLCELLRYIAFQLVGQSEAVAAKTKSFVAREGVIIRLVLDVPPSKDRISSVIELFHGYSQLFSLILDRAEPALEAVRETLLGAMLKFADVCETLPEHKMPKLLYIYRTFITLLFTSGDVNGLVKRLCKKLAVNGDESLSQLIAYILQLSAERGGRLDAELINQLLGAGTMPARVSSALVSYISGVKEHDLDGVVVPRSKLPEQMAVVCALVPKVPTIRDFALGQLEKDVSSRGSVRMLPERISALLDAFSTGVPDTGPYMWTSSTHQVIRDKLQKVFDAVQPQLLQAAPDLAQVDVLRRAASLFPSLDRRQVLRHIANDRKRSGLSDNTVALIDALVEEPEDVSTADMKGWLLMAFDHLTRRFAEDAILDDKVTAFAQTLGKFFFRREVPVEKAIPRTTLNVMLEVGLQKHINIPEVVYFVVTIVSLSSPKSLDLAKLLQIVLGHPENPLAHRNANDMVDNLHYYVAFLISRLFRAGKVSLCNIGTLDHVMELYRGTNGYVDSTLLEVITYIEGHLVRSCANRVASWLVVESADSKHLISRSHGRLSVTIDAKMLARSIFNFLPQTTTNNADGLNEYLETCRDNLASLGGAYDPRFMLPALTYCIVSETHIMEVQAIVDRHCIGYAISCLSSEESAVRQMAVGFITAAVSKLEDSPYRGKTQVNHLLLGVLASLASQDEEMKDLPLPSAMTIFLAQAVQVLSNPTHFLFENVMELLLRSPLLQLHDIPFMLNVLQVGEEHHKEVAWILNIVTAGLKTERDLGLYRKRNVFGNALDLYISPNSNERTKGKVLELLWNAAAIEGGGTTLITRNGLIAWIEQQLGTVKEDNFTLKRLAARLWESSAKNHVKEWSRQNIGAHFAGERARLGIDVAA